MEEKSNNELSMSMSSWKLKQESLKNLRNHRQLENRLVILELERQSKIKSIQKKLEAHRKLMEIRMDRYKLKQSLEKHDQDLSQEAGNNSRIFKDIRLNRAANIRSRSNQCKQSNFRLFKQIKKQKEEHQRIIKEQTQRELQMKTEKRNRVRMIEIECKENVNKFWRNKLQEFKEIKEYQMNRNLLTEEKKMEALLQLQKSEADLLSQIKKADDMETQLISMMAEQKSMVKAAIASNS